MIKNYFMTDEVQHQLEAYNTCIIYYIYILYIYLEYDEIHVLSNHNRP